ncbi:MAG TPA: NADPH-dependent FMN reductase [Methylocystis sp.]|nr:NADPH-dependent FMN reductase [Methylocystis sp.]
MLTAAGATPQATVQMRILAISGSLRARSANTATLEAMAKLAPSGVDVVPYRRLGLLPHFNPDLDRVDLPDALPSEVRELRREVGRSDGLLLSSPEYAHGVAGAFKNALDWLVGSLEFPGKPVAVINTAPRAKHADAQLREILLTMSARLVQPASITAPISGVGRDLDASGIAADPALSGQLRRALDALVDAIATSKAEIS